MKKIFLAIMLFLFLFGCSNVEKEKVADDLSFEESLQKLMEQNEFNYDSVIDYDVKGDYIYVMVKRVGYGLSMAILKKDNDKIKWIMGEDVSPPVTSLADKGSPVVTIIKPREFNIKEVKVLGEPVKSITYYDDAMESYSLETRYWIAYTDELPKVADIKFIEE